MRKMLHFIVIMVSADGLAPSGARPSAGTLMTKFMSCIYRELTHAGLKTIDNFLCFGTIMAHDALCQHNQSHPVFIWLPSQVSSPYNHPPHFLTQVSNGPSIQPTHDSEPSCHCSLADKYCSSMSLPTPEQNGCLSTWKMTRRRPHRMTWFMRIE